MKGFSLIELMVVMALLAILAVASFAAYGNAGSTTKVRLAKACVAQISLTMIRDRATDMPSLACVDEFQPRDFEFTAHRDSETKILRVSATPVAQRLQDAPCAQMTLLETGEWDFGGSSPGECQ